MLAHSSPGLWLVLFFFSLIENYLISIHVFPILKAGFPSRAIYEGICVFGMFGNNRRGPNTKLFFPPSTINTEIPLYSFFLFIYLFIKYAPSTSYVDGIEVRQ